MQAEPRIQLFVSRWCAECERAIGLLESRGLAFALVDVGDADACCRLRELSGGASVPQAVVDGRPVGGYDELARLVRAGALGEDATETEPTKEDE